MRVSWYLCPSLVFTTLAILCGVPLGAAESGSNQDRQLDSHVPGEGSLLPKLAEAAEARTSLAIRYDGRYISIPYPMGDVPASIGVCTDVVVRSYRSIGIDLQELVHLDMRSNFGAYPQLWGLSRPDSNIDHRRVPNLMKFFSRHGKTLSVDAPPEDYQPGDIVAWKLDSGLTHIGIVALRRSEDGRRPLVVHNIGEGPKLEDVLFGWKQIGHYRYYGPNG